MKLSAIQSFGLNFSRNRCNYEIVNESLPRGDIHCGEKYLAKPDKDKGWFQPKLKLKFSVIASFAAVILLSWMLLVSQTTSLPEEINYT